MLTVVATHPTQYHAPVYRWLQTRLGIPVTVLYGSDFSVAGYRDPEFATTLAWETDLLSGYSARFLARVADRGPHDLAQVSPRGLLRALRDIAPGAVLLTGTHPWFHQAAFFAARRLGVPLLFRGEAADHTRARGPLATALRDRLLRWEYRRCARLLYIGQQALRHFRRLGAREAQLLFSPYCVDTAPFQTDEAARTRLRPDIRRALGVRDDQRILLFSGKLVARKGPDLLVKAVRGLPSAVRDSSVVVFLGDGPLAEALDAQGRAPSGTPARFVGFQHQTALSAYYHAADLLVLPSRWGETWGLVVNEALHHGLPCVVSSAVGCAPDLVQPGVTGERSDAHTASALAEAIARALPLAGRAEVRAQCRRQVEGYSVDQAARGIAAAYRSVVA